MTLSVKLEVPVEVMARQVGEETVILHLESGTYYGLDAVGARIWQLIVEGRSLGEICRVMIDEYDVEQLRIERDVLDLASALEAKRLVRQTAWECHTSA
ncbi:MAG: PqqD family protein [Candidatus Solibacter sp.]|nr:PqqD family protein [Candidatus Solibacter sp.]